VSTSAVDTWRDVKIQTKNLTDVPNEFLPLIQVLPMIQNKTEVLNLKSRKTQVPIGYLTLNYIYRPCNVNYLGPPLFNFVKCQHTRKRFRRNYKIGGKGNIFLTQLFLYGVWLVSHFEMAISTIEAPLLSDTVDGAVDYKGRPVLRSTFSSWRSASFIIGNTRTEPNS
jgi:hypothetical protein